MPSFVRAWDCDEAPVASATCPELGSWSPRPAGNQPVTTRRSAWYVGSMSQRAAYLFAVSLAFLASACGGDEATIADAGTGQDAAVDSGNADGGTSDGGDVDSGNPDSGNPDSGSADSGNPDSGPDSGAFDVKNVPGLALWLDGSKGVTADGSGNVSKWADQSGNANDAVQATANRQPSVVTPGINGKAVIRFNPPSVIYPYLSIPDAATLRLGTGDFYIAAVAKRPADNAFLNCVLSKQNAGAPFAGYAIYLNISAPHAGGQLDANNDILSTGGPYGDGVARQFGFVRAAGTATFRVDGATEGTLPATAVNSDAPGVPLSIGGVAPTGLHPLVGDLAELVIVKGTISGSDMAQIEAYLKAKYAL